MQGIYNNNKTILQASKYRELKRLSISRAWKDAFPIKSEYNAHMKEGIPIRRQARDYMERLEIF